MARHRGFFVVRFRVHVSLAERMAADVNSFQHKPVDGNRQLAIERQARPEKRLQYPGEGGSPGWTKNTRSDARGGN